MTGDVYFSRNAERDEEERVKNTAKSENIYVERLDFDPDEGKKAPEKNKQAASGDFGGTLEKKKKKKHIGGKIIAVLLALILIFTGIIAGGSAIVLKDYEPKPLSSNAYVSGDSLLHSSGVYNILLMGIDSKKTASSSRSDAMILLSVNTSTLELKLTSFMRDSYVTIPGHGMAKLNAACTYGGPQLVIDTIEYNFGIDIDAYCKIGYDMFITLVDGIGGITVSEIDEVEAYALKKEGVKIEPGTNIHLNGKQALHYCRIRKGQSDFARTERQREAITLIIKKAIRTNPVTLLNIARKIVGTAECSLSKAEIYKLALKILPCVFGDIGTRQIPADGTWYNDMRGGQAVLVVDAAANTDVLNNFIYG